MDAFTALPEQCCHELFELQAHRTPDATALRQHGVDITFADLNARANQLAHHLLEHGVGPDVLVGLCLPRSPDAIIAILGILKAGGGYVSIETDQPLTRAIEIIKDAHLSLVIADADHSAWLRYADVTLISVEHRSESTTNVHSDACLDNIAYVTYTSGSTGAPLGVIAIHRSITNGLNAVPFDRDQPDEVCSLNSSLSFGFSVSRLFLPLMCGVPVVILSEAESRDAEQLTTVFEAERVTSAAIITPLFREILTIGPPLTDRLQGLRRLAVGGAALAPETIRLFRQLFTSTSLRDGYAASEIGGPAIIWEIRNSTAPRRQHIFANVSVYVLDDQLQPVPMGALGELYVSGQHLARGYLAQPALTAERFLKDPFSNHSGMRMFRTGDVCRYSHEGDIQIVGRNDEQVKVRGHRVNLRELDDRLQAHELIFEAASATFEAAADLSLAAYVVPVNGAILRATDVQAWLSRDLPPYMVPAAVVFMESLPRTLTGKLDRLALPAPRIVRPNDGDYAPPRNHTEATLVAIWMDVLRSTDVGINDSFFDLGGDSLSAVLVTARVLETLGVELPAEALLEHFTIARLSEVFFDEAAE